MAHITELVGIYHANGSWWGEITYWVGARLGAAHCALCDITHGTFTKKPRWTACEATLGVPFVTFHLNDRPADVAAASGDATPCVLARVAPTVTPPLTSPPADSLVFLLGPRDLEACAGDPGKLVGAIGDAASRHDLGFVPGTGG